MLECKYGGKKWNKNANEKKENMLLMFPRGGLRTLQSEWGFWRKMSSSTARAEIKVGDHANLTKTFTEEDVLAFAKITMVGHPFSSFSLQR